MSVRSGGADTEPGAPVNTERGAPATVVLADDHVVVRAGMRALLSQDGTFEVVAETGTVPETLEAVRRHRPAVLVLDLAMGGRSSLPAVSDLLTASPGTRILVLTMHDDPAFVRAALRAGASGYLLKEAAGEELVAASRQVSGGATYVQPALGARLATAGAPDTVPLTGRETEVLSLLALGHTNQEIARRLHVSLRTVETHRARIRDKLGAGTRADLIAAARDLGLLP